MPTQVLVALTPALREFLADCDAASAKEHANGEEIDLDELYRLVSEHQKKCGETSPKLHELLAGAEVVERKQLVRDGPELTPVERMRLEAQERAYQRSVGNLVVDSASAAYKRKEPGQGAGPMLRFATNFATQVAVAFIGGFVLGYFFVETFVDADNFSAKVIAGAGCSFATLLLETFLLVVRDGKDGMIKKQRQREAELAAQAELAEKKRQVEGGVTVAPAAGAVPPADELVGGEASQPGEPKPATEKKKD